MTPEAPLPADSDPQPSEFQPSEFQPDPELNESKPFLDADDLLSSAAVLRRQQREQRRQRRAAESMQAESELWSGEADEEAELLQVSLDELEDAEVESLFSDMSSKSRDHLKTWCESVDEDVWVLNLDADDDLDDDDDLSDLFGE
ncbi:MAG TPA: hypothetical protein DEA08_12990 [Planctomycetes bacterium]|nr:hypothetical protein [Planctomycetota bacterium]|tara:strand:- start:26 stop:460 length:435 start_codon:yes stop_codon:yes gene_type:complete